MLLKRGLPLLSPLVERLSLMISQISFCLNNRKTKFNNIVIGHYSILLGSRNYHIWSKCIISTISAYSVLRFWRWNSHVCGTPCWSRPYRSSTEVETSRQTYSWPYGYVIRLTIYFCFMSSMTEQIRLHSLLSQKDFWDKLKTFFGTTSFTSCLSFIQTSPTQTRSHPTCSDRYRWYHVTPRSHNPSWVDLP